MIKELKEVLINEAKQNGEKETTKVIERATTLSDLGYTFMDAIKKLKQAGVAIVITKEEKERKLEEIRNAYKAEKYYDSLLLPETEQTNGSVNRRKFESTADIIMVHKTDYAPKDGQIQSRHSGGVLDECNIKLGGEEYSFTCQSGRDTVHLSANHEVSANDGGSWSKMKYAVLIPFDDLKRYSAIINAKAVDTYTKGAVNLTENSYILCPKGEGDAIQKENPNVTVIEYEGEYVQDFANMLLSELGYKLELGNEHGFEDSEQAKKYHDIMIKEGFTMRNHFNSEDKKIETQLSIVYQVVGIMKLISDEKIMEKLDREVLIEDLISQHFFELIDRFFIKNSSYYNLLIEELKKIGMSISLDDFGEVIEAHQDEYGYLDMPYESILTGYMLDVISKRSKSLITPTDIAEADIGAKITGSEIEDGLGGKDANNSPNIDKGKGKGER